MTLNQEILGSNPSSSANNKNMIKDKLGQEIKVGSYIVYGHNVGRCGGLRVGIVKEILENKDEFRSKSSNNSYKFKIRGIDDDWNWDNYLDFSKIQLLQKDSFIQFTTRIIVLNDLPLEYKKLLNN